MRRSLLCVLLILTLAACGPSGGDAKKAGAEKKSANPMAGMPPPEVSVAAVALQSLPVSFEYVGQTAGSREAEVRARVQGILVSRNFREGEAVHKGQSLYSI